MRPLIGLRLTAAIFLLAPALVVASPGARTEASPAAAGSSSIVTLITGERVQRWRVVDERSGDVGGRRPFPGAPARAG